MEIRLLSPRELSGLAQAGEAVMGTRFPTALQLVACTRKPSLVSAVVAGDEIVAAALADLTREEGVRVGRIWLLASFLGDEELDRRLKWALLLGLQATFRRLRAKRLELRTERDDGLARMILRRLGDRSMPVELRPGPDQTRPRLRLVPSCGHGEGLLRAPSRMPWQVLQ